MPGGAPALYSEVLGLSLHARGRALRLRAITERGAGPGEDANHREKKTHPATGEDLLTPEEESSARGEAEARAEREAAARRAVEAENAELRARLRELEHSARASGHPQS